MPLASICRFRLITMPSPGVGDICMLDNVPCCKPSCETKMEVSAPLSSASSIIRGPDIGVDALVGVVPGVAVAAGPELVLLGDCHDRAAKMPPAINNSS